MVGYQGWFRTPNDASGGNNWFHYQIGTKQFQPGAAGQHEYLNIDYWPDVSALPPTALESTPFTLADGKTPAPVNTSYHKGVIAQHFAWMQQYGIAGAFVQRFATVLPSAQWTQLLKWELAGAASAGRTVAVMYDLSGASPAQVAAVAADWTTLCSPTGDNLAASPSYQQHNDKPVVGVFGVGFDDGRTYTTADVIALLTALKSAGVCLVLGVPRGWRIARQWPPCAFGTQDATNDANLPDALKLADIIMPWTVGRFGDLGEARLWGRTTVEPDLAWCRQNGIEYLPVVWPGFSNQNQQAGMAINGIPGTGGQTIGRVDGRFLWEQYYQAVAAGCTMVYQAMFDEMDEGTQIMPVAPPAAAPTGQNLQFYLRSFQRDTPLPGDFYLQVAQLGAAAVARRRPRYGPPDPLSPTLPHAFAQPDVNAYLAATDAQVERAAQDSFETNSAIEFFMPILAAWIGQWAPLDPVGTLVRQTGTWEPRPATSRDPAATIAWQLPVPAAGLCQLQVRLMGDAQLQHLTDATLVVTQGNTQLPCPSLNQQVDTQRWNTVTTLTLAAGTCQVTASYPSPNPANLRLAFFEARLVS